MKNKPMSLNAMISKKARGYDSPEARQKAMKSEFDSYKKKTGNFHEADMRHAMNAEGKMTKMKYGGMGKKRPEMMKGGMANGKKHMYAAGGSVRDNKKA
ncbi:MAG: hypothetical protein ACPF8W_00265 [Luminiphilus sp.]